jgi:hypothetical protein
MIIARMTTKNRYKKALQITERIEDLPHIEKNKNEVEGDEPRQRLEKNRQFF